MYLKRPESVTQWLGTESNRRHADFQEAWNTHGDLLRPAKSHPNIPKIHQDLTPSDSVTRELTHELTPDIRFGCPDRPRGSAHLHLGTIDQFATRQQRPWIALERGAFRRFPGVRDIQRGWRVRLTSLDVDGRHRGRLLSRRAQAFATNPVASRRGLTCREVAAVPLDGHIRRRNRHESQKDTVTEHLVPLVVQ